MDIAITEQRLLLYPAAIGFDEAKGRAYAKRMDAFGAAGAVGKVFGLVSKPSEEDFELTYSETRFEPFWHVVVTSRYVYDRSSAYQIAPTGPEVKRITLQDTDYEVLNGHLHITVTEHCIEEASTESLVDGVTGRETPSLKRYLDLTPTVVAGELREVVSEGTIVVPPQSRVSALMRQGLAKMIKGIEADSILEEDVQVPFMDLHYRPVYAFKYKWISKGREGIIEIDGLTGEVATGTRIFSEYLGKLPNRDFFFDVGADLAGTFIPGAGIAVKVVKRAIDAAAD